MGRNGACTDSGTLRVLAAITAIVATVVPATARQPQFRRLSVREYRDKMTAGWVGQMVGVSWGAPTEFRFTGRLLLESEMPKWQPGMVNDAFGQDDLYVEMTFLRTLEARGLSVSSRQAGLDFANSKYGLWHANAAGRSNLRKGIAPPDSGHPQFNKHADDIDYQIEADFSGLIAPGLPNAAIALGEKFGRLVNYGDGLYGGQFVGGMYAAAFFESDPAKIVEAGLRCIPQRSQYAEAIRDVLRWRRENPGDWQQTWGLINQKYQKDPNYRRASCTKGDFNIDAKMNGAYVALALLYGDRDPDKTSSIAIRSGQDSDCNPSNAAGVLFTSIGFSRLPKRFTSELNRSATFSNTEYDFPRLVEVCEKLARRVVIHSGGRIEKDAKVDEAFIIPVSAANPSRFEQCWVPGPIVSARYTAEEMLQLRNLTKDLSTAMGKFAPGWALANCGYDMNPGLYDEWWGKKNVLVTHPLDPETGCMLSSTVEIPASRETTLRLTVGRHPQGDWVLIVRANGEGLLETPVDKSTAPDGWREVSVDLSRLAGRRVALELVNQPSGWHFEAAYWARIYLVSEY